MNRFFYHGIEFYPGAVSYAINMLIKILDEGLKKRDEARNISDESLSHICLYRKNEVVDYSKKHSLFSVRDNWIDNQFVIIVKPDINARKAEIGVETDLIDEWRSDENIPPSSFVGIALPFDLIEEYLKDDFVYDENDKDNLRKVLPILIEKAQSMGLAVVNSCEENFADNFDGKLNQGGIKKQ